MKKEILEQALDHIRDSYITEAANRKKRQPARWLGAIAAVLALALLVQVGGRFLFTGGENAMDAPAAMAPAEDAPAADTAADEESTLFFPSLFAVQALAKANEPRDVARPEYGSANYDKNVAQWLAANETRRANALDALSNLEGFFQSSSQLFLSSDAGENKVWSPANGYIALAMLAESTDGSSRQQILELLNTPDMDTLRTQVSAVWETCCYPEENGDVLNLANSLWLKKDIDYNESTVDNLAYHHYASVYRGELGSSAVNKALQNWINDQTGGLLADAVKDMQLSPDSVLALVSTVYLRGGWTTKFDPEKNTEDTFHSPKGEQTVTFMHMQEHETNYYWGENYGAIGLHMGNGCWMWLFLPDEGTEVAQLVEQGDYLVTVAKEADNRCENRKWLKVNLSVPKFDVDSSADLKEGLQQLGVTDVFSQDTADFSATFSEPNNAFVDSVQQAARMSIDEEGAEAASVVLIDAPASAQPQETEIIDFILDRPFLAVISRGGVPVVSAVVNEP